MARLDEVERRIERLSSSLRAPQRPRRRERSDLSPAWRAAVRLLHRLERERLLEERLRREQRRALLEVEQEAERSRKSRIEAHWADLERLVRRLDSIDHLEVKRAIAEDPVRLASAEAYRREMIAWDRAFHLARKYSFEPDERPSLPLSTSGAAWPSPEAEDHARRLLLDGLAPAEVAAHAGLAPGVVDAIAKGRRFAQSRRRREPYHES